MFTAEWKQTWAVKLKVLIISSVFASIGNWISTTKGGNPVNPLQAIPALLMILAVVVVANLIDDLMRTYAKIKLPSILYISMLAIVCSIPGFLPFADYFNTELARVGLLPLCTPILAYAGISLGKDWKDFKEQGVGIVVTAIMAFIGTYIGSAVIAQIVLMVTGQI